MNAEVSNEPITRETLSDRLFSFGLLGLIAFGMWIFFALSKHMITTMVSIDSKIGAALIAASGTVFVSVFSILISRHLENRTTLRKEHREKKIPVYEQLLHFMGRLLMSVKTGEEISEQNMQDFMLDFTQKIMVWGSEPVLNAYSEFRKNSLNPTKNTDPAVILLGYENLIFAMRKDLGHSNSDINAGSLLSLFINDIDTIIPQAA